MISSYSQTFPSQMPYEKFISYGAHSLTDEELLAVILRTGTKNKTALELGHEVLHLISGEQYGLLGLHYLTLEQLKKVSGIGEVKAVKLKCISELAVRMSRQNAKNGLSFQKASTIANYYMESMRHRRTECVLMLLLDVKGRLLKEILLSKGTVNCSLLSTREVFVEALRYEAVHFIILHNHPSGNCHPSESDHLITEQLKEAGELLNILILDHIIIGDRTYYSFKESGYL